MYKLVYVIIQMDLNALQSLWNGYHERNLYPNLKKIEPWSVYIFDCKNYLRS